MSKHLIERPEFLRTLVLNAVRKAIAAAISSGSIVSASECAAEILRTYPACDLDQGEIENEVMMAAAKSAIPVELGASHRRKKVPPAVAA